MRLIITRLTREKKLNLKRRFLTVLKIYMILKKQTSIQFYPADENSKIKRKGHRG